MKRYVCVFPLLLFSLFFSSCGQEGPFMPVSNMENAVTLNVSVSPGKIVDPDTEGSIGISLTYDDNRVLPAKMEIALLDKNDAVVGTPVVLEGADLDGELPAVDTTSLKDGLYKIRLRVYDAGGQIIKESLTPFFDSRIHIQIEGVDVYPPEFSPGSSGLIFPKVDAPGTVWVRWSLGDTILSEGTLASYHSGLVWNAPRQEGVYTVKMEVFPFAPPDSVSYTFSSSLSATVQVFVTNAVTPDIYDLSPENSYTTLLNLNGNLVDEGVFKSSTVRIGDPSLILDDGGFGYRFTSGDGIVIDSDTLPVSDGVLSPFSTIFRFKVQDLQEDKYFLRITGGGSDLFSVKTDASGRLVALLKQPSGVTEVSSGIDPRMISELTLSVVPSKDTIRFLWYGDGELLRSDSFAYVPVALPDSHTGTTVLGGEKGFSGFIDYFGIFFRDNEGLFSTDDGVYRRFVMRSGDVDSSDIVEGFDGLYVPPAIAALNSGNNAVIVAGGNLVIAPGGTAVVMKTGSDFSGLKIKIETAAGQENAEILFGILKNGESVGTAEMAFPSKTAVSHFTVALHGGMLKISRKDGERRLLRFQGDDTLEIVLKNRSNENPLKIASFFCGREGEHVVENRQHGEKNNL